MTLRYTHFQMFCGFGGLAAGIDDAQERLYGLHGSWECIGAVDSCPDAVARFNRYCRHPVAQVVDLFSLDQYRRYHGADPPAGWRETQPEDLRRVTRGRAPTLIGSSPPCRGFSRLVSQSKSTSTKYQALNELAFRGIWLALEAWTDDPPALWILENVPGITNRGSHFIEQIRSLFRPYGYSVTGERHCLGEIGGLGARRNRFMLVARHTGKLPALLYRPRSRSLRTVGEVLDDFPLPGDPRGGALHQPKRVSFRTAVRLALIKPGHDWRYLRTYSVNEAGNLRDFVLLAGGYGYKGALGVTPWDQSSATLTTRSAPTTGCFSVEDPRAWMKEATHRNVFRVTSWEGVAGTVTTATRPASGGASVGEVRTSPEGEIANPQAGRPRPNNVFRVVALPAVTAGGGPSAGGLAVANPMDRWMAKRGDGAWAKAGNFGVLAWTAPGTAVTAYAGLDNGRFSVAEPRLPDAECVDVWVILSVWGSWNRPLTDLELAALQSLVRPEDVSALNHVFEGASSTMVRRHVGNAVPRAAAREIGKVFLKCLLAAEAGETFTLDNEPAWAFPRQIAVLCSLEPPERRAEEI